MKKLNKIFAVLLTGLLSFTALSCQKKPKVTVIGYRTGSLCAIPIHIAVLTGLLDDEFEAIGQKVEALHQTGFSGTTAELVGSGIMNRCCREIDICAVCFVSIFVHALHLRVKIDF